MADKEILYDGRFVRMVRKGTWEYAERQRVRDIVMVIPITDGAELVLNEQFRIPVGGAVIEIPAGLVGDIPGEEDEDLDSAARRELLEETGFAGGTLTWLTAGPPSAGITSEVLTIGIVRGCRRVAAGGGDESERITVHVVPLTGVTAWLREQEAAGKYIDPKVFIGLYFAGEGASSGD